MESREGEIYTVPVGLTVHCHICGAKLESGTKCWIEHSDSSAILCMRCMSKRQHQAKPGPAETKLPAMTQEVANKAAEWMEYD